MTSFTAPPTVPLKAVSPVTRSVAARAAVFVIAPSPVRAATVTSAPCRSSVAPARSARLVPAASVGGTLSGAAWHAAPRHFTDR